MEGYGMRGRGMEGYGVPPGYGPGAPGIQPGVVVEEEEKSGFVVMIEGYSPYKDIAALLDPHSVGDDQSKWGVVTRLVNISKIKKGCPFELFKKDDIKHFVLEKGPVDLRSGKTPAGVGVEKEIERVPRELDRTPGIGGSMEMYGRTSVNTNMLQRDYMYVEQVLIDPMTGEEMSKVFDIVTQEDINNDPSLSDKELGKIKRDEFNEPQFIDRDYWFRISAKFLWKGAPPLPQGPLMYDDSYGMGMGMGRAPGR